MTIQGPLNVHRAHAINRPHFAPTPKAAAAESNSTTTAQVDQLDISPEAQRLSEARDTDAGRADRIAAIKAEIEAGTYETEERLSLALDRLLDDLA